MYYLFFKLIFIIIYCITYFIFYHLVPAPEFHLSYSLKDRVDMNPDAVWLDNPILTPIIDNSKETCYNTTMIRITSNSYFIRIKLKDPFRIQTIILSLQGNSTCLSVNIHAYPSAEMCNQGFCVKLHCGINEFFPDNANVVNGQCVYTIPSGARFTDQIILNVFPPLLICDLSYQ